MKRLEKQFIAVSSFNPDLVTVHQRENIFHWEVVIKGPVGSPYQGYDLIVYFDFPEQFPFKFPMIKFKTHIWHPNVKDGDICKEMVGEAEWQPNKKVQEIVQALLSMLVQPDLNNAINSEAAHEYKQGKYEAHAKQVMAKIGNKSESKEVQEKKVEAQGK